MINKEITRMSFFQKRERYISPTSKQSKHAGTLGAGTSIAGPSKKKLIRRKNITVETPSGNKTVSVVDRQGSESNNLTGRFVDHIANPRVPFFIPPMGRTLVRNKSGQKAVQVDNHRLPYPPPMTPAQVRAARMAAPSGSRADIRLPTTASTRVHTTEGFTARDRADTSISVDGKRQFLQGAPTAVSTTRILRKYISSLGKGGTASIFSFVLAEPMKRITKLRFVSINCIYVVPVNQPTMGIIHLQNFPEQTPYYLETGIGKKFSATFPLITGTVGSTVRFQYVFPDDYYLHLDAPTDTVDKLNFAILKEDLITTPGEFLDFSDSTFNGIEMEFHLEKHSVA